MQFAAHDSNVYRYAHNTPNSDVDPLGLEDDPKKMPDPELIGKRKVEDNAVEKAKIQIKELKDFINWKDGIRYDMNNNPSSHWYWGGYAFNKTKMTALLTQQLNDAYARQNEWIKNKKDHQDKKDAIEDEMRARGLKVPN
jgi:hypothetical protein